MSRQDYHLTQPFPSEEKQTNKGKKNLAQISPYMKLTQTTGPKKEFNREAWKSESEVAQSWPTLCDSMDCSPSDSSAHVIFQARVLE